jgi:uncharacterized protein YkwD
MFAQADEALAGAGPTPGAAATSAASVNKSQLGGIGVKVAAAVAVLGTAAGAYAITSERDPAVTAVPVALATTTSPSPSAKPSTVPSASPSRPSMLPSRPSSLPSRPSSPEAQMLVLVNQERAKAGCKSVRDDGRLAKAAEAHSADMAARGYFSHETPEGVTPWDRAEKVGYATPSAENIAAGNADAKATMDQLMNSPGHRANILNCGHKALGIGRATGGPYRYYWTQLFGSS